MDMTEAVHRQVIKLYELYLEGKPVNVIDPDGSTPSKEEIRGRVHQLKQVLQALTETSHHEADIVINKPDLTGADLVKIREAAELGSIEAMEATLKGLGYYKPEDNPKLREEIAESLWGCHLGECPKGVTEAKCADLKASCDLCWADRILSIFYKLPKEKPIVCPFCGEDDFDQIGLKYHLSNHCKLYQDTEVIGL